MSGDWSPTNALHGIIKLEPEDKQHRKCNETNIHLNDYLIHFLLLLVVDTSLSFSPRATPVTDHNSICSPAIYLAFMVAVASVSAF